MLIFDLISHLLIGAGLALFFWRFVGLLSFIFILIPVAYLIYAWKNAASVVAAKAGFRPLTLVQRRYLDYLAINQEVFTHPTLLPIAGTLASSRRRLVLLSAGIFDLYENKSLSEDDLRQLIAGLAATGQQAVFGWTFHLATGGLRLFSRSDAGDPLALTWTEWWRKILTTVSLGGLYLIALAAVFAASISPQLRTAGIVRRPINVAPIIPVFWLPFVYLAARYVWRRTNAALIKPAAEDWNKPISLERVTFVPMFKPTGNFPNLDLLKDGLLIGGKRRHDPREEPLP